jgi:hypothetical protein
LKKKCDYLEMPEYQLNAKKMPPEKGGILSKLKMYGKKSSLF